MVRICTLLLLGLASMGLAQGTNQIPSGWILAGSRPGDYRVEVDPPDADSGKASASLTARVAYASGFGTLMQSIKADVYRGRHVRFTARLKTRDVEGRAVLWLRVDGPGDVQRLDNMSAPDRALQGNNEWTESSLVLNVPEGATAINYGFFLMGTGRAWMDDPQVEAVSDDVPETTAMPVLPMRDVARTRALLPGPENLGFAL